MSSPGLGSRVELEPKWISLSLVFMICFLKSAIRDKKSRTSLLFSTTEFSCATDRDMFFPPCDSNSAIKFSNPPNSSAPSRSKSLCSNALELFSLATSLVSFSDFWVSSERGESNICPFLFFCPRGPVRILEKSSPSSDSSHELVPLKEVETDLFSSIKGMFARLISMLPSPTHK